MAANFYNLPDAWDPGYAPYDPAEAEGLERRAITTQQLPNGTYDEIPVGDGGYAVPKYVLAEGYGQGAAVTKWMPRGTVDGNPNWLLQPTSAWKPVAENAKAVDYKVAVDGLGDDAVTDYGARAADPFAQYGSKGATLLFAKIARVHPSKRAAALRSVMNQIDPTLHGRAVILATKYRSTMPPAAAYRAGVAQAMSEGLRNEVIALGKGKRPKVKSHLGLAAVGSAPALAGVLEELGAAPATMATVVPTASKGGPQQQWIEVGPFRFTTDPVTQIRYAADLTPEWKTWVIDQIKKANVLCNLGTPMVSSNTYGLDKWIGMPNQGICPLVVVARGGGDVPLAIVKHPVTNEKWGLFVYSSKSAFEIYWKKLPRDLLGSAFGWIASIPAKLVSIGGDVIDFAGDALESLKNLACQAVNGGGAAQAAAATGGVAGVAGAAAAATICTQTPPAPMPPPNPTPGMSTTTLLLLGGAAAVGLYFFSKKGG